MSIARINEFLLKITEKMFKKKFMPWDGNVFLRGRADAVHMDTLGSDFSVDNIELENEKVAIIFMNMNSNVPFVIRLFVDQETKNKYQ